MRSQLNNTRVVTLHSAVATLPVPTTAASGADVRSVLTTAAAHSLELTIQGDAAATLSNVKLWGYDGSDWFEIARPNNGLSISIISSAAIFLGYSERFIDIAIYERLMLSATVSAGNITVKVREIENMETRL